MSLNRSNPKIHRELRKEDYVSAKGTGWPVKHGSVVLAPWEKWLFHCMLLYISDTRQVRLRFQGTRGLVSHGCVLSWTLKDDFSSLHVHWTSPVYKEPENTAMYNWSPCIKRQLFLFSAPPPSPPFLEYIIILGIFLARKYKSFFLFFDALQVRLQLFFSTINIGYSLQ